MPDLSLLIEYSKAVRDVTLAMIKATNDEQMYKTVGGDTFTNNLGSILAHIATEEALHVGQIAYLRGIK